MLFRSWVSFTFSSLRGEIVSFGRSCKKHFLYDAVQVLGKLHIFITEGRDCLFWQKLLLCLNHHQLSGVLMFESGLGLPVSHSHLQGGKEGGKGVPLQIGGEGVPFLQTL